MMWRELTFRDAVFGARAAEELREAQRAFGRSVARLEAAGLSGVEAMREAGRALGALAKAMPTRKGGGRLR